MRENTDVLIMGSGAAGMAAAIEARNGGAAVILLEKSKNIGGVSVTGMGIFAVESHLQKSRNLNFTRDDAFKLFMEKTQWKADPMLVRAYVDKTADTIDWLEDMGVEFQLLDKLQYPSAVNLTGHLVVSPKIGTHAGCTAHMVNCMCSRAEKLGAEIRKEAEVLDIARDESGYVVLWKDASGGENEIRAKAVVIAAGGFVYNKEMLANVGFTMGENLGMQHKVPLTGEGIQMAWKLGAVSDGMCALLTSYMDGEKFPFAPQTEPLWNLISFSFPYLWVNKDGQRFVDEGNMNGAYLSNAIARQRDGAYFLILDSSIKEIIRSQGPDIWGYLGDEVKMDLDEIFDFAVGRGWQGLSKGESIEELANKIEVPADQLKATVDQYNAFCAKGHDDLFAKDRRYLRPIEKPTYYAIRRKNSGYGTVGGIRINHRAEAIGKDYRAIPGLFAAGDCANGTISYNTAMMYEVWGGTLSFATNVGRIAGESAAAFVKNSH